MADFYPAIIGATTIATHADEKIVTTYPLKIPRDLVRVHTWARSRGAAIVVRYAMGYLMAADGTMVRKAIWEKRTPDEADPRIRVKVGEHDPQPVDSLLWKGLFPNGFQFSGQWIDGRADEFVVLDTNVGTSEVTNLRRWSARMSEQ